MGCPVNSIKEMEDGLRYRRQKMVIVIFANANSDSDAVNFILNNFHEMDIISDDVDFYLPGYGINKFNRTINTMNIEWANKRAQEMFPDFHCDIEQRGIFERLMRRRRSEHLSHCKIIESPRLGEVIFNIAEFTDFVYEFTNKIDGYHYLGGCQMILLQPNEKGLPDYCNASVYDLDAVIASRSGCSLDAFLHRTFNIIRDYSNGNDYNHSHSRFLNALFRRNHKENITQRILREIDKLYFDATRNDNPNDRYEIIIHDLIADMSRCLDWDVACEDFYFISYSSQNVMKANSLKILLQHHGLHVWIAPDGIPQGREYPVVIPTALKLAKVFVLLLTPESAQSQWVRRELAIAISNNETRIKVLLSDGITIDDIREDIELRFLLDRVQVKFDYSEVIHSHSMLDRFIRE